MIKRTQPEIVLLSLSALSAATIFPFIFVRLANDQPIVAFVNVIVVLVMLAVFIFVYKTRNVEIARLAMSFFLMAAVMFQVKIQGPSGIYWFYPTSIVVYYLTSPNTAVKICCVSMLLSLSVLFPLIPLVDFVLICVTALLTNVFAYIIFRSHNETQAQLKQLATTDALTLAGNRRALDRKLSELIESQKRAESLMCLILFDLDHFKKINDNYGHAVGDDILVAVSKLVVDNTRVLDSYYRYGGEEFIIMPLLVDLQSAQVIAEKLRILIENHRYPSDVKVTVSLGVAQYQPGETSEEWIGRADSALYNAKETGRNKVCLAH